MSIVSNTQLLATRIGEEFNAVRTEASAIASNRYTKAEVDAAIADAVDGIINGAPGALDTLNELAAALGEDANFAATITAQIALKANTSDVNSALALKADSSGVYTKSQTDTAIATAIAPLALTPRLTLNLQTSAGSITTDPVIANAMTTIANTNGYTVNLGFGEYRETGPIVLDNKWQLQLVGPQSAGTTAVTIKNGITIQNSNGVRLTRIQVEGTTSISCRAGLGLYFEKVQLMGNVTLGGTGGFMMFVDTDFAGDVTISPTFAGVVYFMNCNFSKAAGVYTFGQSSALQAIFSNCSGIPNAGIAKAAYTGTINYKNGSQALFLNNVAISNAGATTGQVLKFNGTSWAPAADAAPDVTKSYVDTALALKADASAVYTKSEVDAAIAAGGDLSSVLALTGGTMSGEIDMGFNAIVGLADPTMDQDAAHKKYVDDGLALKANVADVYTKPEVNALVVDTGDITFRNGYIIGTDGQARLAVESINTNGNFALAAGVDYTTATWDGTTLTFTDTTQSLYDALNALGGSYDIIELTVNGTVFTVTSTGSSTPPLPQTAALYLNEEAVGGPLEVSSIFIESRTGMQSFVEISGSDFRVDAKDDVRIYGNDTFLLSNRSTDTSLFIETNDEQHVWEFTVEGHLILPFGGEIRDGNGNNVLSGVQINDDTAFSTSVYSSSKTETLLAEKANAADVGDVTTDFVAVFEAALT